MNICFPLCHKINTYAKKDLSDFCLLGINLQMGVKGNIPFFSLLIYLEISNPVLWKIPSMFASHNCLKNFNHLVCFYLLIYLFETGSHCVDQAGPKLTEISLLLLLKC